MRSSLRQVLLRSATGLDLNFAGGVFSLNNTRAGDLAAIPGWSFSRTDTNGTATALDLAGNVIQFPSRTNLLLQSQTFDNASWTKTGSAIVSDAIVGPDGTLTVDKLNETAGGSNHNASQIVTVSSATQYTFSIVAKAGERTWVSLYDGVIGKGKWFNLATGAIGGNLIAAPDSAAIVDLGGGFYRCSITITTASTTSSPSLWLSPDGTSFSYTGVAGSGIYLWGAQLETGSTATAYIPTTTAAVTVVLPRITNRGILVEEARTNILSTSNLLSGPWASVNCTPVASSVLGPNGSASTEFTFTVATAGSSRVFATTATAYGAQTWTGSMYLRADAPITAQIRLSSSAVRVVSSQSVNITTAWQRFTLTATGLVTDTGGASFDVTSNGTADIKIYAALAQLELGAFATSPIITTGAAGTRDGETVSLGTAALPPEGTIILTYVVQPTAVGTAARTYGFNLTDAGNSRFSFRIGDIGLATTPVAIIGDGAALTTLTGSSLTPGTTAKVAVSYSSLSAQFAMAVNGSDQTGARQAVAATLALTFRLGSIGTPGTNAINSPIARAQIIPRFLSAAERIALTAP